MSFNFDRIAENRDWWHKGWAWVKSGDPFAYVVCISAEVTPDKMWWVSEGDPQPPEAWLVRAPLARFETEQEALQYVDILSRLTK